MAQFSSFPLADARELAQALFESDPMGELNESALRGAIARYCIALHARVTEEVVSEARRLYNSATWEYARHESGRDKFDRMSKREVIEYRERMKKHASMQAHAYQLRATYARVLARNGGALPQR